MKQKLFFCIVLLVLSNPQNKISGQEAWEKEYMRDPFWQLSSEEKVKKVLEEFRYNYFWARNYRFYDYEGILMDNNPQENIQVLLEYFEKIDMSPYLENNYDHAYDILDYLLQRFEGEKLLNQNDLHRLCAIWQQKIHKYLNMYKVVDRKVVATESIIQMITGKREPNMIRVESEAREVYVKYIKLGYKDLRIDLERRDTEQDRTRRRNLGGLME